MRRRPSIATLDMTIRRLQWAATADCFYMPTEKKRLEIVIDWLKHERALQKIQNAGKRVRKKRGIM